MIRHDNFFKLVATSALVMGLAFSLSASSLEDARGLLKAGKPGEVDTALGALLDRKPVPLNVLELSFQAARQAGKPYTAERRYAAMLEKGEKLSAEILFNAAIVAHEIGKPTVCRDRLVFFLNSDKSAWNIYVEQALAFLCRDGGSAEHFARYVSRMSANDATFSLGLDMLSQMRTSRRTSDYIEQTDALLAKFTREDWRARILEEVSYWVISEPVPNFRKQIFAVFAKYPLQSNGHFMQMAYAYNEFNAPLVIDFCVNNKVLLPDAIFARAAKLRSDVNDSDVCASYGGKVQALSGLVLAKDAAGKIVNPASLATFIEILLDNEQIFRKASAPIYSKAQMASLFDMLASSVYASGDLEDLRRIATLCVGRKAWQQDHLVAMIKKYPKAFDYRTLIYDTKISEEAKKAKDASKLKQMLAAGGNRPEQRLMALGVAVECGDKAFVREIIEEHVLSHPVDFDANNVARNLLRPDMGTPAEVVGFLRTLLSRTGYSEPWKQLTGYPVPASIKADASWKAFVDSVTPATKGSDPIIGSCTALYQMPNVAANTRLPAEVWQLAQKAITAYKAKGALLGKDAAETLVMDKIWTRLVSLIAHKDDNIELVSLFADIIVRLNVDFGIYVGAGRNSQNVTNMLRVVSVALKNKKARPDDFYAYSLPKGMASSVLSPYYGEMSPYHAASHVVANCETETWSFETQLKELNALVEAHPFESYPAALQSKMLDVWLKLAPTNSYFAKIPLEKLAVPLLDKQLCAERVRAQLVAVYGVGGKIDLALPRFLAGARKLSEPSRYNAAAALAGYYYSRGQYAPIQVEEEGTEELQAFHFKSFLREELLPAIKAVPRKESALISPVDSVRFCDSFQTSSDRDAKAAQPDVAFAEFSREFALRTGDGIRWTTDGWRLHRILRVGATSLLSEKRPGELAGFARQLGQTYANHVDWQGSALLAFFGKAVEQNAWEAVHIVASSVGTDNSELGGKLQRMRAECATHMPGIYPVAENHPLYPLYVAADELEHNNPERAWALLQKNLQTFEREAVKLPPNFVAWSVEQLRQARGKKDALLTKARLIATKLLAEENTLTPELAASLMLSRAECFRDQRNYEAARLEYQTIRNGEYYQGTRAARRAMFRDVDLLIDMGNVSAAEQLIEYWLSQPDVEIQAQAHYFMARIAFDRKDYEETRKELSEVFNLDFTHTEGRLLHGAWKLATNSEVDDTNVILGNIADRTIIRPGQELSISVQDRNLGVAGAGASIPILITTSVGRDAETIQLYPSARNPYIFNGSIPTALGVAVPTNRVLEVLGSDEVSYSVDAEFLRVRGLTTTPPKMLRVIDDARLAIGAAAPLAEDGKAEADLERQLTSTSTEPEYGRYAQVVNNLKPGNPIYIVVRDRDRSVSSDADSLTVEAKTSSGDRLERVVLQETGPVSGIFRGSIKTQLPPPRAFASDTASGFNAGDVINSTRKGVWKSVADGAHGKWLEVDTMGSHSISNVAIMMSEEQAKNITSIRLIGKLIDETTRFGALPQEDVKTRYGLRYQVATGRKLNQEALIRAAFVGNDSATPKKVPGLAFTPVYSNRDAAQNALLSGPFMLPEGQRALKLRLLAKDTKGRTLAGLWTAIAIDGVTVFTGQGNSLHRRLVEFDVAPGPHQLEIFFSASFPDDALDILVEDSNGSTMPFPEAWTDPQTAPALEEFVQDRARIIRVKGGFQATFREPVRVRSLRWEFLDYTGRELEISKLYIQNEKGELIIPVASDYSDALMNDTLEVAPGDSITVSYIDEKTSSGEKRVLEKNMRSSFNNAQCNFFFEKIVDTDQGNKLFLFDAYRFLPGDMLLVSVLDPDADTTPEADSVKVKISTRSGKDAVLTLVEQRKRFDNIPRYVPDEAEGIHGGHFLGQLRTCAAGDTNANASALPIAVGDVVTMTYFDRENTSPGVPVERTVSVSAAQTATPQLQLFDTTSVLEEDTSIDAKLRLEQIRRRPGNERIEMLYREELIGTPMSPEAMDSAKEIPINVAIPIPLMVTDASRARHEASVINVEAFAASEIELAEMDGREPEGVILPLKLGVNFGNISVKNVSRQNVALDGVFSGNLNLRLGPPDPSAEFDENAPPTLSVNGNDTVHIRVLGEDGAPQIERTLKLVSAARIALMDSTYSAERASAHVGERFFVMVEDQDRDTGDELNELEVAVSAVYSKVSRKMILRETLPHSGIFTGMIRPVIFAPGEEIPPVATGGVAVAAEDLADDRIAVRYGDVVNFAYLDEVTIPSRTSGVITASGKVFKGSDGDVRLFSKRFRDGDMAVLVQFRLAECLFESAKEHRRLKQPERSAKAIEDGKFILEEALRNYPTTIHITQGEYLLANLYQELAMEQKEAGAMAEATPLFTEALSRFSSLLSAWPDSEYAPRAQYHKALCLEMLGDYNRASEEYVKMTYLYPESPLVGDASIRLATYYYKEEKRYATAGRIYANFQRRFPTHDKADRALFMAAQCHMKQAEAIEAKAREDGKEPPRTLIIDEYNEAIKALATLVDTYRDTAAKNILAQSMYWAGDASLRALNYEQAFIYLKRTVFEYPETEWARRARGLLLQEQKRFEKLE